MDTGEKMTVATVAKRRTSSELIGRFGLRYEGNENRFALRSPFEPIGAILDHCEEKTSAIMKLPRENA